MRKVIVYKWDYNESGFRCKTGLTSALFHQFGIGYDEIDGAVGQFTTAIIEYDDGQLDNVPVELIRFVEPTKEGARCLPDEKDKEIARLKGECNTLNQEANRLKVATVNTIAEKDGEIAKLKAELEAAQAIVKQTGHATWDAIAGRDREITELRAELERVSNARAELGGEVTRLKGTIDALHAEIRHCGNLSEALRVERTRLKDEISSLRSINKNQAARLKDTIDNLANSNDKTLEAMKYEIAEADKQIEALESLLMRWASWAWATNLRGPHDEIYSQLQRDTHAILNPDAT